MDLLDGMTLLQTEKYKNFVRVNIKLKFILLGFFSFSGGVNNNYNENR